MAAPIPTEEPKEITAGDSASWTRNFSDYSPGDGWALTYALIPIDGQGPIVTFASTNSNGSHLVALTPADTQYWIAGEYRGQGYVTKTATGERHTVWEGRMMVQPDYSSAGQIDTRTKARRILDFIDQSFERVAKKQVVESTVEGVSFRFRSLEELMKARNYWAAIVATEEANEDNHPRRCILAKFTTPA